MMEANTLPRSALQRQWPFARPQVATTLLVGRRASPQVRVCPHSAGTVKLPLYVWPRPKKDTASHFRVAELSTEADGVVEIWPRLLDAWTVAVEVYEHYGHALPCDAVTGD